MQDQQYADYDFTEQWVSHNLPHGTPQTTTQLYSAFMDRCIEQKRKEIPTRKIFLSRLNKMEFLKSDYIYLPTGKKKKNGEYKQVRTNSWSKVEVVKPEKPKRKKCSVRWLRLKLRKLIKKGFVVYTGSNQHG